MHFALLTGDLQIMASAAWNSFGAAWESFAESAGSLLITSIWQGAVIVGVLEIAMRLMPRVSAAHRFAAWAAGFGFAAALPLIPLIHFATGSAQAGTATVGLGGGSGGALFQLDARWGMAIAAVWVVASMSRFTGLALHSIRLRRLWKTARPFEISENLSSAVGKLRSGRVEICTTKLLDRPSVIGFFAPRILIPEWLIARVTDGELNQIVLHEAEHLRRRDDWTNLLQKLCMVLFPLNPALAWMEHRLCGEREMACDEGVVRVTNAPRAYAACLANLAERGLERRAEVLSLGAWHRRSELVDRVHRILLRKPGMSGASAGALLGTLGCMLIAGSVEMARCPQLVAFVPQPKNLAMTPARQKQLAALLAQEDAQSKMVLPPNFHAVQTRALMPAPRKPVGGTSKHEEQKAAAKAVMPNAEQIAKASPTGDRVNQNPDQQWVVLAAWEEVQTVSRSRQPVTDYDAVADASQDVRSVQSVASSAAPGKAGTAPNTHSSGNANAGKTANAYTITRLILRVVPANSNATNSTQSAAGSIRGGWLVFQL